MMRNRLAAVLHQRTTSKGAIVKETYGIGIVGCGNISDKHATAVNRIEGVSLVAVSSRSEDKALRMAQRFGCEYHTDYEAMFARDDIDVIIICTPNKTHASIGIEAARSGKHVIVEKPIDSRLEATDALIRACRSANVKLTCIFQHRFDPGVLRLKEAVENGELGRVSFGGCYVKYFRSQGYFESSPGRGSWESDGGGAVIINAIHYIDVLQHLLGPAEEVFSYAGTLAHDDLEVEDVATAVVRFKCGALGTVEASSAAFPGLYSRIELNGDAGSVVMENNRIKDWRVRDHGMKLHPLYGDLLNKADYTDNGGLFEPAERPDVFARQIDDFIHAIDDDREPYVSGESARHSLAIVLAIYESAASGKPVRI